MPRSPRSRRTVLIAALGVFAAVQLIPYGRAHTNPPVAAEPVWAPPATRVLFERACGDCHSHATRWPWYSHLAPASWMVAHDVEEGREHFNVSEWGLDRRNEGAEAAEMLRSGEMPPWAYRVAHPEARLSAGDRETLLRGLDATFNDRRRLR